MRPIVFPLGLPASETNALVVTVYACTGFFVTCGGLVSNKVSVSRSF